jgi:hypothetical protein
MESKKTKPMTPPQAGIILRTATQILSVSEFQNDTRAMKRYKTHNMRQFWAHSTTSEGQSAPSIPPFQVASVLQDPF